MNFLMIVGVLSVILVAVAVFSLAASNSNDYDNSTTSHKDYTRY